MATPRKLENAPLREAVIDIRVSHADGFDPDSLRAATSRFESEYPTVKTLWMLEGQLLFSTEGQPQPEGRKHFHGLRFEDVSGTQIVQFRTDGFTFSRLAPYTNWGDVFPEAMRLWNAYVDMTRPAYASRLALRYINAIEVPTPVDLEDVFTTPPRLADDAPAQTLVGFLMRTTGYDEESQVFVHSTHALERVTPEGTGTVVLDIDAYREADFKIPTDMSALENAFLRLRTIKNATFFAAITEETARRHG